MFDSETGDLSFEDNKLIELDFELLDDEVDYDKDFVDDYLLFVTSFI
jgi:hypothetical protein